jgi:hypothetical protein
MRLPTGQAPETGGFTGENLDRRIGIWLCACQHPADHGLVPSENTPARSGTQL